MTTQNSFSAPEHITVLLHEAVNGLALKENGIYIDGTFGRGGHSRLILSQLSEHGRLIAVDRDPRAIAEAEKITELYLQQQKFHERIIKTIGGVVTVTLGVTLTLLGLKVIGSDDDLPQIGNDENVA